MDSFDKIRSAIYKNYQLNKLRCPVSIGIPWFPIFEATGSDGIVTDVAWGDLSTASWHNAVVSKWVQKNGQPYLAIKSWQGENFGDHGYIYFSRFLINRLFSVPQTEAYTIAPKDSVSINTIKVNLLMAIISYMKTLLQTLINQKKSL